jgi:hypothetical protein
MPKRSRNKYRQRSRARIRRTKRRGGSTGWNVAIGAIVIVGVVGVALARSANSKPSLAHRHAAFGVNVCGRWEPDPPETARDSQGNIVRAGTDVYAGLHTHGDGLIHFEPVTAEDAGSSATVGRFFKYNGWDLSQTSFTFNGGVKKKNGDLCPGTNGQPGEKGTVEWAVDGKKRSGDPAGFAPQNGDKIVIAFVPKGGDVVKLGDPPSTKNLPQALGVSESGAPATSGQTTITVPPSSTP